MPVRNGFQFALYSLDKLKNLSSDVEIIIVDDGSVDGSFELCVNFTEKNSNFRVLKNPGRGISDALNYGIEQARGSWIARFDIDDNYCPARIDKQIELINSTGCILAFSDYSFYANGIRNLGLIPSAIFSNAVKLSLVSGRRTPHPSAFFQKDAYLKAGGYLLEDSPAEDLSLWLRMHSLGEFASLDSELLQYRLAHSSTTMQSRFLSIAKRRQLLEMYPITIDVFHYSLQTLDKTFNFYDKSWKGKQRTLLHILDIYLYASTYKVNIPKQAKIVMLKQLLSISGILACASLTFEAFKRYNFRKSNVGE